MLFNNNPYHKIFTHLTISEKKVLYKLASEIGNGVAVEIGSYYGGSSAFIALGLKILHGHLNCIDTWTNSNLCNVEVDGVDLTKDTYHNEKDIFAEFLNNTKSFENITTHRGLSADIAKQFNKTIDLLFIDGDHSEEGVLADWNAWSPKLNKERSIVILHDWDWCPGVKNVYLNRIIPLAKKHDSLANMVWAWL